MAKTVGGNEWNLSVTRPQGNARTRYKEVCVDMDGTKDQ